VVLDHRFRHDRRSRALDHGEVARADPRIARHVDALDIDAGRDLPVDAHLPGHHEHHRSPVEADDGDFIRLRLHHLE
jgi:hypothetical protein